MKDIQQTFTPDNEVQRIVREINQNIVKVGNADILALQALSIDISKIRAKTCLTVSQI
jgi:hypothetical protein